VKNMPRRSLKEIDEMINAMRAFFNDPLSSKSSLVDKIVEYVPTFEHIERGKNLDQKM
jgi:hypothetical protein